MIQAKHKILLLLLLCPWGLQAQDNSIARPSPMAMATVKYKDTYVKITYGQPRKRGRTIFGGLVPFGMVWRTGANEATEITLTKDILINKTQLSAGTYSLFTIPEKESWIIIINKDVGLWGSYNYNPKMDVLRFTVPVADTGADSYETFTIQFDQRTNLADLLLFWDKTKIRIPIQFIEPKQP
jgi:hypothetical protein